MAFAVLVERLADDVAMSSAMSSSDALLRLVTAALAKASGSVPNMPLGAVRAALAGLKDAGVGLTRMQMATVGCCRGGAGLFEPGRLLPHPIVLRSRTTALGLSA